MASDLPRREVNAQPPVVFPARKPVLRARRISLFEREIRINLSPAAMDLLLQDAALLSEGEVLDGWYGGSTMMTFDLTRVSDRLSEACDVVTARHLEDLLASDPRVRERVRAVAHREAEACAGQPLGDMAIDIRVHREGRHVHLDADVEARTRGER